MIYDKEKYTVKDKYPRKEDYILFYVYSRGSVAFEGTFKDLKSHFLLDKELGVTSVKKIIQNAGNFVEESFNEIAFKRDRKAYYDKENDLISEYKKALYEEESLFSDEMNDIIYSRAWSENHSEGYESVEEEFTDLLDFVGDIIKQYKNEYGV